MSRNDAAATFTVCLVVLLIIGVILALFWVGPLMGQRAARIGVQSKRYGVQRAALTLCQNQIKGGILTDRCLALAKEK